MQTPRFSIRLKLTIGSLLPLFVAILFCSLTGIYIITTRINVLAQEKVRTDLNSAREVYSNEIGHIRDVVRFSASMPFAAQAVFAADRGAIATFLSALRRNEQLDILTAVDIHGRVLYRAGNPDVFGDLRSNDHLVRRALRGEVIAGSEVFQPKRLLLEGMDLARRAAIDVIPTERAKPGAKKTELSGMLLVAAAPVKTPGGEIVGALYGGVLLNGNNAVVDRIKKIVYEGVQFEGKDVGTATIFLDDTRISTNVQTRDGKRAIGTRMSAEVYNRVVHNREKWVDRAFVVNDWYFSAYEPILDLNGWVIGSLYVGMREQPNTALKKNIYLLFGGVLLLGSLIGFAISGFISSRLAKPIRELQNLVKRFSAGERGVRIETKTRDEIGELASEFNAMTGTLMQREAAIVELNRSLELKVRERTAELEAKNRLLVKTQEELVRAEKLAAIGELAAGVAHEINNPMAIIRGNTELLQMAISPENPSREEVDIISHQVGRVERIVASLLLFARKEQKNHSFSALHPMLDEILGQMRHQAPLNNISIRREYAPDLPPLESDPHQLHQVFTNLILNAVQAMPDGGVLTVATRMGNEAGTCQVSVADTGCGINAEILENIFNPFFTTKRSGTGLGLAVSYGIVKEHGGKIEVTSESGRGSVFRVILPLVQMREKNTRKRHYRVSG